MYCNVIEELSNSHIEYIFVFLRLKRDILYTKVSTQASRQWHVRTAVESAFAIIFIRCDSR
jgi:hypothetical protein